MGLTWLPSFQAIRLALYLVLGCSMVGLGLWGQHQKNERLKLQAQYDHERADANKAAGQASEAYRRLEQQMQQVVDAAAAKFREKEIQHAQDLDSVRAARDADVRRLRVALSAATAASGAAQGASAPAGDCAATAGELLGEGLQVQAELADAAERNADAYRALREAWPGEVKPESPAKP
jgi:hypothetical protein